MHPHALIELVLQLAAALLCSIQLLTQHILARCVCAGTEFQLVESRGQLGHLPGSLAVSSLCVLELTCQLGALSMEFLPALLQTGELLPQLRVHVRRGAEPLLQPLALGGSLRELLELRLETRHLAARLVALGNAGSKFLFPSVLHLDELPLRVICVLLLPQRCDLGSVLPRFNVCECLVTGGLGNFGTAPEGRNLAIGRTLLLLSSALRLVRQVLKPLLPLLQLVPGVVELRPQLAELLARSDQFLESLFPILQLTPDIIKLCPQFLQLL
mmetsp:Transcript_39462/g.111648  ORF Transcript_39462/g.111648 Transcript_39462/m.111648 type:complete len:271 (-) Transcript_39462:562-1374(-)